MTASAHVPWPLASGENKLRGCAAPWPPSRPVPQLGVQVTLVMATEQDILRRFGPFHENFRKSLHVLRATPSWVAFSGPESSTGLPRPTARERVGEALPRHDGLHSCATDGSVAQHSSGGDHLPNLVAEWTRGGAAASSSSRAPPQTLRGVGSLRTLRRRLQRDVWGGAAASSSSRAPPHPTLRRVGSRRPYCGVAGSAAPVTPQDSKLRFRRQRVGRRDGDLLRSSIFGARGCVSVVQAPRTKLRSPFMQRCSESVR